MAELSELNAEPTSEMGDGGEDDREEEIQRMTESVQVQNILKSHDMMWKLLNLLNRHEFPTWSTITSMRKIFSYFWATLIPRLTMPFLSDVETRFF